MFSIDYIRHHGIKGMKLGVRRFQNEDGSLTEAGKERYTHDQMLSQKKRIGKMISFDEYKNLDEAKQKQIRDDLKKEMVERTDYQCLEAAIDNASGLDNIFISRFDNNKQIQNVANKVTIFPRPDTLSEEQKQKYIETSDAAKLKDAYKITGDIFASEKEINEFKKYLSGKLGFVGTYIAYCDSNKITPIHCRKGEFTYPEIMSEDYLEQKFPNGITTEVVRDNKNFDPYLEDYYNYVNDAVKDILRRKNKKK